MHTFTEENGKNIRSRFTEATGVKVGPYAEKALDGSLADAEDTAAQAALNNGCEAEKQSSQKFYLRVDTQTKPQEKKRKKNPFLIGSLSGIAAAFAAVLIVGALQGGGMKKETADMATKEENVLVSAYELTESKDKDANAPECTGEAVGTADDPADANYETAPNEILQEMTIGSTAPSEGVSETSTEGSTAPGEGLQETPGEGRKNAGDSQDVCHFISVNLSLCGIGDDSEKYYEIEPEDMDRFFELVGSKEDWTETMPNCMFDVSFKVTNDQSGEFFYDYHTECGNLFSPEECLCICLSEDARTELNAIIGKYTGKQYQ